MNVSRVMNTSLMKTMTGTPYYIAPEIWKGEDYDFKSDIWALGVVLYELACLKFPFNGNSFPVVYNKVIKGKYDKIPKGYSKDLSKLIKKCFTMKMSKRPSATELISHKLLISNVDDSEHCTT